MTNEEKILELLSNLRQDVMNIKQDAVEICLDIEESMDLQRQALAGRQKPLLNSKNRIEALEKDVDVLKAAFRGLSREVSELKRAQ